MENKQILYESPYVEMLEMEVEQSILDASSFKEEDGNWG